MPHKTTDLMTINIFESMILLSQIKKAFIVIQIKVCKHVLLLAWTLNENPT